MDAAIPCQEGFAQTRSGGNQRAVPSLAGVAIAQRVNLIRRKLGDAVAVSFEIVDEKDVLDPAICCKVAAVDRPRQIREAKAPGAYWPRHAKTGSGDLRRAQKLFYDLFKPAVTLGRIALIAVMCELSVGKVVQRQVNFGASYVACQNHLALSKIPRPSPSVAGRSAAAA